MSLDDDLLDFIEARIGAHERSNQVRIGPSGLGTPCTRKLGFRLAEIPELTSSLPPWRPTVGTAVHAWLADMLTALNLKELGSKTLHSSSDGVPCKAAWCDKAGYGRQAHTPRFLIEFNVLCGTITRNGEKLEIHGTVDVFDRLTGTVVDWKVNGPHALKDFKAAIHRGEVPSESYRVQSQTYGRGLAHAGFDVRHVAIMFLPMNGELRETAYWTEPFDPEIGKQAFTKARKITAKFEAEGIENVLPKLKRASDYCGRCEWFNPNTAESELARMCPGSDEMRAKPGDSFSDLLG